MDFSGAGAGGGFTCADFANFKQYTRIGSAMFLSWVGSRSCDRQIEPSLDLPIGLLGETDRAGLGDAFQPRGDVDALAHQIAIALLDHVAQVDPDAKFDPRFSAATPALRSTMARCTSSAQRTASTTLRTRI